MQLPVWEVVGRNEHYGLGVAVMKIGQRTMIGHGGGYPGHITATAVDPHSGLAVSVLTNSIDGAAAELLHGIVKLVDLALTDPSGSVPPSLGSRLAGRYANLWSVLDVAQLGRGCS